MLSQPSRQRQALPRAGGRRLQCETASSEFLGSV